MPQRVLELVDLLGSMPEVLPVVERFLEEAEGPLSLGLVVLVVLLVAAQEQRLELIRELVAVEAGARALPGLAVPEEAATVLFTG